jgi:hypothetical protein
MLTFTFLAVYAITSSATLLMTLALKDDPAGVLHSVATLIQISLVAHVVVAFTLMIWAMLLRGQKRAAAGRVTFVRSLGKSRSLQCMARPRQRRVRGKSCSR